MFGSGAPPRLRLCSEGWTARGWVKGLPWARWTRWRWATWRGRRTSSRSPRSPRSHLPTRGCAGVRVALAVQRARSAARPMRGVRCAAAAASATGASRRGMICGKPVHIDETRVVSHRPRGVTAVTMTHPAIPAPPLTQPRDGAAPRATHKPSRHTAGAVLAAAHLSASNRHPAIILLLSRRHHLISRVARRLRRSGRGRRRMHRNAFPFARLRPGVVRRGERANRRWGAADRWCGRSGSGTRARVGGRGVGAGVVLRVRRRTAVRADHPLM